MQNKLYRVAILVIACFTVLLKCDLLRTDFLLKYPYQSMVRLKPVTDNSTRFDQPLCTGMIVNSVYILTHARCSDYAYYKGPITVVFVTSSIHGVDNASEQMGRWIRHESYKHLPDTYDLALLELRHVISFNHFIHPAVMYYGDVHLIESHLSCSIIGYNDSLINEKTDLYFSLLAIMDVQLLRKDLCQKMFPAHDNVACAVPLVKISKCNLDLGTPLACGINNIWIFFGIYTGTNTCSSTESVFLFRKIDHMHEWLMRLANGAYVVDGNAVNKTKDAGVSIHKPGMYSFSFVSTLIFNIYLKLLQIWTHIN